MPSADVIIMNARVFTSDEANPRTEAVAVKGNRIIYVGTNEGAQSFRVNPLVSSMGKDIHLQRALSIPMCICYGVPSGWAMHNSRKSEQNKI